MAEQNQELESQQIVATTPPPPARPNPQRYRLMMQKASRGPWWILVILGLVKLFVDAVEDRPIYQLAWEEVRKGLWTTIWVTLVAYGIALLLGLFFALMRRPSDSIFYNLFIYQPTTVVIEIIRGIPTLVLVFYITLAGVPQLVDLINAQSEALLNRGTINGTFLEEHVIYLSELTPRDIPTVYRAIAALAISYAAFLSEIFRAGLDSVDIGQREAARSMGMKQWQIMLTIILPQAIRNILPALGNDFIAMLKESSLVSVVGVQDITRSGQSFAAATFTFFQAYNVIAVTYLVLTISISIIVKIIELYLGRGRKLN
ncbi:MAG: amino acid ABC transporter [Phototrophicales bacterium]|nr:MAG: amino acid ABC transporter [Phototrophicales bacterium]